MRLFWIAALMVGMAGCLSSADDSEGAHLIAHITSPVAFDHMIVTLDDYTPQDIFLSEPETSYDFDHWEVFDEITDLKVTLTAGGNAIASGEASHILYRSAGDGSTIAEITLRVTP